MRALRPAADPLKVPYLIAWAIVLGFVLLWTIMWGINAGGDKGFNTPIALISFFLIMFCSYGPSRLIEAGVLGSIYNALNLRNPLGGFGTGLQWHTRIVMIVLYVHLTVSFLLMTWPFAGNPGAFWYCLVGILTIVVTMQVYSIKSSKLIPVSIIVFVALCILVAMLDTLGIDIPAFFGAIEKPDSAALGAATPWWIIPAVLGGVAILALLFFLGKGGKGVAMFATIQPMIGFLVAVAIIGGGFIIVHNMSKTSAACPANPGFTTIMAPATTVDVSGCWSEVFVATGEVRRYDVRFADPSSPRFVGRTVEDFVFIDRQFPGQPAHTLRVRPNREAFRQAGIDRVALTFVTTDTFKGPVVHEGSSSSSDLDWFKSQ